ncbi:MAG: hypothetical protein L6R28_06750 [Planctomycetes bacterium]|nr:hypothetical protein [Planctomycetota bacterium]
MKDSSANACPCAALSDRHPGKDLDDLPELKARVAWPWLETRNSEPGTRR